MTLYPDVTLFPGQGVLPIIRCLLAFDDVSVANPTWVDQTTKVRSYSVSRGRSSELEEFDAGSATVVFDDRARTFDPAEHPEVRPFNRLWLYMEFSGEILDVFYGYVQSWNEAWDQSGIVDATSTAVCADELMILASAALRVTDPPTESYSSLVGSDNPYGFWDFNEDPDTVVYEALAVPEVEKVDIEERTTKTLRRASLNRAHPKRPRKGRH